MKDFELTKPLELRFSQAIHHAAKNAIDFNTVKNIMAGTQKFVNDDLNFVRLPQDYYCFFKVVRFPDYEKPGEDLFATVLYVRPIDQSEFVDRKYACQVADCFGYDLKHEQEANKFSMMFMSPLDQEAINDIVKKGEGVNLFQ